MQSSHCVSKRIQGQHPSRFKSIQISGHQTSSNNCMSLTGLGTMAASTDLLFLECLSKSRRKSEMAAITHGCLKWRCAVHEPSFLLSAGELLDILGQGQQTLIRRRSCTSRLR